MKKNNQITPSIALVYDKLTTRYGGAEWVLLALHQAFPKAPLYTTIHTPKKTDWAQPFTIFTSFLQKLPFKNHQFLVWLFPLAFESLNLSNYDVVISITSGEAKGIITKPDQLHICYMLTPPRYLYSHKETYFNSKPILKLPIISHCAKKALSYLRWWDQAAAARPDKIIAISKKIQTRIQTFYGKNSDLIYPPLPLMPNDIQPFSTTQPYFLSLSRLVAYKRIDLSIKATLQAKKNLIVAGSGEEQDNLIALAGKQAHIRNQEPLKTWLQKNLSQKSDSGKILFVGHVSNQERLELLAGATAILMPGLEDFGITALEAAALGTPSILHRASGVSEILTHKVAAWHISEETQSEVFSALQQISSRVFDSNTLQTCAQTCSTRVFTSKFSKYMYDSIILLKSSKKMQKINQ